MGCPKPFKKGGLPGKKSKKKILKKNPKKKTFVFAPIILKLMPGP
jgi:hypothetical protein